jgi:hypothetical protein
MPDVAGVDEGGVVGLAQHPRVTARPRLRLFRCVPFNLLSTSSRH